MNVSMSRAVLAGGIAAAAAAAAVVVVSTHSAAPPVAANQAGFSLAAPSQLALGQANVKQALLGQAQLYQAWLSQARAAGAAGTAPSSPAAASSPVAASSPAANSSSSCPDVNVVFARGTGEQPGLGIVGTPFAQAVASDLPGKTVTDYAVNYAADVSQASAGPGATDMTSHIVSLAAQCPATQFVIGGYSQGASVTDIAIGIQTTLGTGSVIPAADAAKVRAVVVFGNPLRLSGQTIAADSPAYGPKSDEFCNAGDPVCGNGSDILAHLQYATNGTAQQGAQFAAGKVSATGG